MIYIGELNKTYLNLLLNKRIAKQDELLYQSFKRLGVLNAHQRAKLDAITQEIAQLNKIKELAKHTSKVYTKSTPEYPLSLDDLKYFLNNRHYQLLQLLPNIGIYTSEGHQANMLTRILYSLKEPELAFDPSNKLPTRFETDNHALVKLRQERHTGCVTLAMHLKDICEASTLAKQTYATKLLQKYDVITPNSAYYILKSILKDYERQKVKDLFKLEDNQILYQVGATYIFERESVK